MLSCSAVSYEWGSSIRQHEVLCEGSILKVTANLSLLLSKLRTPHSSRLLWIDAICIDQDNMEERSQQVSIMANIYKNAVVVLMWIGDEVPYTKEAMIMIRRLATFSTIMDLDAEEISQAKDKLMDDTSIKQLFQRMQDEAAWPVVIDLLKSRTYFSRLWIMQEIILSSDPEVLCGTHHIRWELFFQAATFLRHREGWLRQSRDMSINREMFGYISMIGKMAFDKGHNDLPSLSELLTSFPKSQATDPRDCVYALLGLPHREHVGLELRIDYSKSVEEVFQHTTECCMAQDQDLLCFLSHGNVPSSRLISGAPSWVVDFGDRDWMAGMDASSLNVPFETK